MQRVITRACLVGSVLIILATFGFYDALLMFVLIGAIPGSSETLSPTAMSMIMSICTAVIIAFVALPRVSSKVNTAETDTQLKRRYSHS